MFTKVSDLKWISVWCKSYSQNFGTLYIPKFDENNANPDSDKKKGSVNPDSDKKKGNVNPDSDKKGNVNPNSDKKKGDVNPDSDKKGNVNPDSEPDFDDHIIIEPGSDMENNKASGMKFAVISTLIAVFLSFSFSRPL